MLLVTGNSRISFFEHYPLPTPLPFYFQFSRNVIHKVSLSGTNRPELVDVIGLPLTFRFPPKKKKKQDGVVWPKQQQQQHNNKKRKKKQVVIKYRYIFRVARWTVV